MLPNNRDLRYNILPYPRNIAEEEHSEEACYTTEGTECHSAVILSAHSLSCPSPSIPMCIRVQRVREKGDIQSASTLESPSAEVLLHRVPALVSPDLPSSPSLPFPFDCFSLSTIDTHFGP
jgi:hypothetical protein